MRCLNHGNVVGSVTNSKGDALLVFLDGANHHGLLLGGHTAAHHRVAAARQLHECRREALLLVCVLVGEDVAE